MCKQHGGHSNYLNLLSYENNLGEFMGNTWHHNHDELTHLIPDEKFLPCVFCGSDSICVTTTQIDLSKHGYKDPYFDAHAWCHDCSAKGPEYNHIESDHPLYDDYTTRDTSDEREVVNFAIKSWNYRKPNT